MYNDLIEKMILVHESWRQHLLNFAYTGINSGWTTKQKVGNPNECEMGLYLKQVDLSSDPLWQEIIDVHNRFHKEAETIYKLAEEKKIDRVEHLLNGPMAVFIVLTIKLNTLLHSLKEK